jgi:hypothetical protein
MGAVFAGPPAEVTLSRKVLETLLCLSRPVSELSLLVGAAPPTTGVATPLGAPVAPRATAHAWPETAALAAWSSIRTVELEVTLTGAWLGPLTDTPTTAMCDTSFEAVTPTAVLLPELAVVMPVGGSDAETAVGASATLMPDCELAALDSMT